MGQLQENFSSSFYIFLTCVHATVHNGGIQPEEMKAGNQGWCQGETGKYRKLASCCGEIPVTSPFSVTWGRYSSVCSPIQGLMAACAPFVSHLSAPGWQ